MVSQCKTEAQHSHWKAAGSGEKELLSGLIKGELVILASVRPRPSERAGRQLAASIRLGPSIHAGRQLVL